MRGVTTHAIAGYSGDVWEYKRPLFVGVAVGAGRFHIAVWEHIASLAAVRIVAR